MAENLLEITELNKSFNGKSAVEQLSFKVRGGETFGLLGPSGAGKTTAMRMIMNIVQPDSGQIWLNNQPRVKIKNDQFGYLPEERGLYLRAHVLDMLIYFGALNNLSHRKAEVEAIRYLDRLGMVDLADARINQLSKGMQQKIQFITAFLHDPDVLILDEPFSGLDPINQIVLRDILKEYKEKNKILIISTHQMEQAEKLCDHICLINQAQMVMDSSLADIKRKSRENAYYVESDQSMAFLAAIPGIKILEENNNAYKFSITDHKQNISEILAKIGQKVKIRKFEVVEPSLHDIFIRLIQEHSTKA